MIDLPALHDFGRFEVEINARYGFVGSLPETKFRNGRKMTLGRCHFNFLGVRSPDVWVAVLREIVEITTMFDRISNPRYHAISVNGFFTNSLFRKRAHSRGVGVSIVNSEYFVRA